ncbi:DUF1702 family protein [Actinoplanes sp. G11-F43]|uniref:DUF1702 family protein n=1 Tax=Actinoplanes sp. G11-F43 TaxID=3424130 RepID=UPI003D336E2F
MTALLGTARRMLMAPSFGEVGFQARGFGLTPTAATRRLEQIPQSVVMGFAWGIELPSLAELEQHLALVEPEMRGFAYEGATMACTIRDAMAGGRGRRTRDLLDGPGRRHIFLAYIGIGFAMARLPRPLWKNVVPDLRDVPYHPVMSWLAVDGYGFDLAYFHTERWVGGQRRPKPYPFDGHPGYFLRSVDHGIGRALWFIHGGRPADVAARLAGFATERHADLWAGVGLAATFAGGAGAHDYETLRRAAGPHRAQLAQGAVFAAKARDLSGHQPAHTAVAVGALTGMSPESASALADDVTTTSAEGSGDMPAYELWRRRIAGRFEPAAAAPS